MSGAALDMTLDDLIKTNKKSGGRGRGRAAGPGPARRQPNRSANRPAPYAAPKAPESAWGHDMFSGGGGGRASSIETGTKLYISNLDYGVSSEDIKKIAFCQGTAEVVFSRRQDAIAAVKKYNNVQLDGKPMKIELVGTNISTSGAGLPAGGAFVYKRSSSKWTREGFLVEDHAVVDVVVDLEEGAADGEEAW
ncbi:hypothetical protein BUALT_Bualt13G0086500 [Buddleja alternifolia]|uniref:RRM domain-containing protein n=1 Tax=Buddleja alternifolia TaxID=168488 RepID=A0AAV6WSJ7_9LAMI|nr:hypothetical protein BUALT_Bualt13G0086500 [Buddleja alternifolia]